MSRELSICIVGAGSSYTPELIEGLMHQTPDELPIRSLRLMDTAPDRLSIMADFTKRVVSQHGRRIAITSDTQLETMVEGVDFVITQIRVGGMRARHLDESIPLKYGIIGQETTGPGGMFKAIRTIPPMLNIARIVAERSPNSFILNYTNPSGIITEAVSRHTPARIIGLCSGIPGMQQEIIDQFSAVYPNLQVYTIGLNHFGHIHHITSDDRDVTAEILEKLAADEDKILATTPDDWRTGLIRLLDAYPIGYVNYFYHRSRMVKKRQQSPLTRAQEIEAIEHDVFAEAADPKSVTKPQSLARRGGGGYSEVTLAVMKAITHDTGAHITTNVRNQGAITGLEDDAVVEVVCKIDRDGAHPIPVGPVPLQFRGLVHALKTYETLTVAAAVNTSRKLATLALLNHPLVGDLDIIEPLLDEMLAAHGIELV